MEYAKRLFFARLLVFITNVIVLPLQLMHAKSMSIEQTLEQLLRQINK
jgi:hypothetical protein